MADICVEIPDSSAALLDKLIDPAEGLPDRAAVVERILDHVQQGVGRPGSWERGWLTQALGDYWITGG